jgi:hypothetical protein
LSVDRIQLGLLDHHSENTAPSRGHAAIEHSARCWDFTYDIADAKGDAPNRRSVIGDLRDRQQTNAPVLALPVSTVQRRWPLAIS